MAAKQLMLYRKKIKFRECFSKSLIVQITYKFNSEVELLIGDHNHLNLETEVTQETDLVATPGNLRVNLDHEKKTNKMKVDQISISQKLYVEGAVRKDTYKENAGLQETLMESAIFKLQQVIEEGSPINQNPKIDPIPSMMSQRIPPGLCGEHTEATITKKR